jgi:hypothetical protein
MDSTQELLVWRAPDWHPDHGDPAVELGHLRSFALKLLSAVPNATVTLETPEPGLMDVRVELACGTMAEVYSVPSPGDGTHRRFAIFLSPDTASESEIYAETLEDASNLFALLSSSSRNGATSESQSVTEVHHDPGTRGSNRR